jgi:hypothetical protein
MAELKLTGPLDFHGIIKLQPNGGKVLVGGAEVLVELPPSPGNQHGEAPPFVFPPPPAAPLDPPPGKRVVVLCSLNKTVTANGKNLVTQGMAMQGEIPTWPGMVMPSQNNTGPSKVSVNQIAVNVVQDQATIFPSGAPAPLTASGQ